MMKELVTLRLFVSRPLSARYHSSDEEDHDEDHCEAHQDPQQDRC